MSTQKYLIIVGGPTASGKTGFAIRLAQHFRTEILSVDSRQFYREMHIGTAKPSPDELATAPHHFVGHLSIEEEYSVGDFEREALRCLSQLFERHSVVIASGGSGLYIKALCEGLDVFPTVPSAIRQEVQALYQNGGLEALQACLQDQDPAYYEIVDQQNPHRLMRAISVGKASGQPFSSFLAQASTQRGFIPIYLQLYWPRAAQYDRINRRVDLMMQAGQLEEAKQLLAHRARTALQTVGYQELFEHLEGKQSLSESIELIKRNTRRYAKRQLTWMRRDGFWKHFHPREWELALSYVSLAMEQDFHIRTATESEKSALLRREPSASTAFPETESITFLVSMINDVMAQAIPLVFTKKELLKLPPKNLLETNEMQRRLLQHEANMRAEDRSLFIVSGDSPPSWQGMAPKKLRWQDLPSRLQKWVPAREQLWQLPR